MGLTIIKDTLTKRNKAFEKIVLQTQEQLKEYLTRGLVKMGRETTKGDGYLFSPGDVPILLVAHMDTVHKEIPKEIIYANGTISSPQGIGGDDRCGIYMVMRLIRDVNCSVLFVEDEEIGCVGTGKFIRTELAKSLKGKFNCLIELDRKGSTDAVFYECDNEEFTEIVTQSFWKEESGSYTDIVELSPVLECASVNLSCGYYKQHSTDEYVVLREMEKSITEALRLIKRLIKANKQYEYVEKPQLDYWRRWGGYSDYRYDNYGYSYYGYPTTALTARDREKYFEIIYWDDFEGAMQCEWGYGATKEEAIGSFLMEHVYIAFMDVAEIVDDETNETVYSNEEVYALAESKSREAQKASNQ